MGEFMLRKLVDAKARPNRETAQTRAEECLSASKKVLRSKDGTGRSAAAIRPLASIRKSLLDQANAIAP